MSEHSFNWKIPYHIPNINGGEKEYLDQVIKSGAFSGGKGFSNKCESWLKSYIQTKAVLMTSSCTHALEMAALLLDIEPGDEVIMPSFNYVSAANAFVLRGAKIVFVDISPSTLNIAPAAIKKAISRRTKGIVVVHYGGQGCEMEEIMDIAHLHDLWVVEDAAHCIGAHRHRKHLGTFGALGVISFHSTKNIHCGEGGALLINDEKHIRPSLSIREKGTNREDFLNGKAEAYEWVRLGSSYTMSELNAAFLYAQLYDIDLVKQRRLNIWNRYFSRLSGINDIDLPEVSPENDHNAHIFPIRCRSKTEREALQNHLKTLGIQAVFHYQPLHASPAGQRFGMFSGEDNYTSSCSERLLRLPLTFKGKWEEQTDEAIEAILNFYS